MKASASDRKYQINQAAKDAKFKAANTPFILKDKTGLLLYIEWL